MQKTAFIELPTSAIEPAGWLRDQLEIQAEGLSGHLSDVWEDVGPNSGWQGGTGESWERGPYYLDGLLPLAYVLKDEKLIATVQPWIECTLASQREDGQFGPPSNIDWWPRMIMLKVLMQYAEATGDQRVAPFLSRYFHFQAEQLQSRPLFYWAEARGGENLLGIQWLYHRTGEAFLLELAELIHRQTINWTGIFTHFSFWRPQTQYDLRVHVVNVAMGLKEPALYYLHSGSPVHRDAARKGIQALMAYHGQAHGMFSGDELLAGTHPSQGVELCAVVEYMFTLENLVLVYALAIGERWQQLRGVSPYPDWEVYPETAWNYGLQVDLDNPENSFQVQTSSLARQPFAVKDAPVRLTVKGRRIATWTIEAHSAAAPPISPVMTGEPEEEVLLVPYGSARLRIAEFPLICGTTHVQNFSLLRAFNTGLAFYDKDYALADIAAVISDSFQLVSNPEQVGGTL